MAELPRSVRAEHRASAFTKFGEEVIYLSTDDTVDRTTGAVSSADVEYRITNVLTSEVRQRDIDQSGGKLKAGDRVFRIKDTDMPVRPPTLKDEMWYPISNGQHWRIVEYRRSADLNVWDVIARRI